MKPWRTDVCARRALIAAALVVVSLAASRQCGAARAAAQFSAEGLAKVGDYIRNEIATGKIPGAILLIQQHGKPVYFENFGVRDVATKVPMTRGHDFPALFDVEAGHVGHGDDAGRGWQALAR